MPVPTPILELLEQSKNVAYNITKNTESVNALSVVPKESNSTLVRSLILRDGNQQVQVLIPSNAIIDLDRMFRHFGRQFEPIPSREVCKIVQAKQLNSIPAVPKWQAMQTYVDDSLLKKDILLLDSGDAKELVQMSNSNFKALIENCEIGSFSSFAAEMNSDPSSDEQAISNSVQKFTEKRIQQRLDDTLELPPLPETAQRIIKLRADPNADISDLTNIVEIDPSLAAQVVSWAASPYYSAPGKIKSVHDAIVRVLGFDMVLNLALGLALGKTLSMQAISKDQLNEYWRSSVYTAAAVEGLVTSIAREHRPAFGMAYLSGLLNNFGFLIMAEIFPPYLKLTTRASDANPHLPNAVVENHVMGVSGGQIASWLLDNWNMPQEVVVALRQQANPNFDGEHSVYAKLNFVARQMLSNQGFGNQLPREVPSDIYEELHLDADMANVTIENILESADDLDAIAEKMRN